MLILLRPYLGTKFFILDNIESIRFKEGRRRRINNTPRSPDAEDDALCIVFYVDYNLEVEYNNGNGLQQNFEPA